MRRVALVLAVVMSIPLAARAEDAEGCKDPSMLRRYPGSSINNCDHKEFDQVEFLTGVTPDNQEKNATLEGEVWRWGYELPEGVSGLQVIRNLETALGKAGFKLLVSSRNTQCCQLTGQLKNTWVHAYADSTHYEFAQVNVKEMEQKMEADASALLDEINKSGHVAVYGITFDTGKATLKPDSEPVLQQVAKLLSDNADLKLRVEGHTDNQGKAKDNLALSKARAQAVKQWLSKNGVAEGRLVAEGFGDKKPVAPNDSEEGRAKNRRVELVKR